MRILLVEDDELLGSPRAKVRKWTRDELVSQSGGRGVTLRSLIPERVPDELLNIMEFAPGASMRGSPHLPGTREFFTCLAGEVRIFVAGDRFDLAEQDLLAAEIDRERRLTARHSTCSPSFKQSGPAYTSLPARQTGGSTELRY